MKLTLRVFQPEWQWSGEHERWLEKQCIGRTLNFPCGKSNVGNVRADLDKKMKPDVIADLLKPEKWTWKRYEFDTVICDPPFDFYNNKRMKWILALSHLAKKKLILSTPNYMVYLPKIWATHKFFLTVNRSNFFIRHWQIYTRKDGFINKKLESV